MVSVGIEFKITGLRPSETLLRQVIIWKLALPQVIQPNQAPNLSSLRSEIIEML